MDLELIRKFCESRSGGLRKLANDIGMSEANLHRCINNNRIQAHDLERIAQCLEVNIGVFFGQEPETKAINGGHHNVAAVNSTVSTGTGGDAEKIKLLEKLLEEKERTIQILLSQHATQL